MSLESCDLSRNIYVAVSQLLFLKICDEENNGNRINQKSYTRIVYQNIYIGVLIYVISMPYCIICGSAFTHKHNPSRKICYNLECIKKQKSLYRRKYYATHKQESLERHRKYIKKHFEERKKHYRNYRINLRREVFQHYSPDLKCACCGDSHFEFLTLDHIHGNGFIERQKYKDTILWVKQNNYPKDYQVLCMNCNFAKRNLDKQFCPVHHPEIY